MNQMLLPSFGSWSMAGNPQAFCFITCLSRVHILTEFAELLLPKDIEFLIDRPSEGTLS